MSLQSCLKRLPAMGLVFLTIAAVCSVGCSSGEKKAEPYTGKPLKIAVIPQGTSNQFWKSVHFGADKAAQELGKVEVVWRGPSSERDSAGQIKIVNDMIELDVDGIILAPNQKLALVDAVKTSIDKDIPVVIMDSRLDEGPDISGFVATDNYRGGQLAAEEMAKAIGKEGNVILLRYLVDNQSTERREQGFLDAIEEYSKINVVSSDQRGGENSASAKLKVGQLLQLFGKDLAGIFAVCEPNANGTLDALRNAGLDGKVKFITFDPSDSLIGGLEDGSVSGIVLQDPVEMGYQSVLTLVDTIQGKTTAPFTSTGEYFATQKNMNDKRIKKLLKPATLN